MSEIRFTHRPESTQTRLDRRENVSFSAIAGGLSQNGSLDFFRQNISLIVKCLFVGLGMAVLYLFYAQPIFTAHAQLLIDPKVPQFLREGGGEASYGLDSSQLESHVVLLQSQAVASSVITKLGLLDDPEFLPRHLLSKLPLLGSLFTAGSVGEDGRMPLAVEHFQDRLRVRRTGISYAIEVAFSSANPEKAAKIANATTEAYLQSLIDFRSESARVASDWLEERLSRLRVQMNDANLRAQQFRVTQDYRIATRRGSSKVDSEAPEEQAVSAKKEQATLEELELTAETYRKVYQSFFSAFTDTVQRKSYPVLNARIISNAAVPTRKSHPRTLLTLALGATFGALMGVGAAMGRQGLRQARAASFSEGGTRAGDQADKPPRLPAK